MPKTTTTKKQNNTKVSRTPKKATTSIKKTTTKATKNMAIQNAYFWGGIGIILCATGALLTLLWGIGNMLNR
jgi:hypothetical protein